MTDRESYIRQETVTGVVPMLKGDRQYSFLDLFLSTSGFAIATWCYTQGAYVAQYLSFSRMLINIFCFNIVWVFIECLPVIFATRYGIDLWIWLRSVLGRRGVAVLSTIISVANFGWYAVAASLFSSSMINLAAKFGLVLNAAVWSPVLGCLCVVLGTLIALGGPNVIKWTNRFLVTALLAVGVVVVVLCFTAVPLREIVAVKPVLDADMTPLQAFMISAEGNVAFAFSWSTQALVLPRLAKTERGGYWGTTLAYGVVAPFFVAAGGVMALAMFVRTGVYESDPTNMLSYLCGSGFALLSLLALGLGKLTDGWTTQNLFCVYRSPLTDWLTYPRFFLHVLGHPDFAAYCSNIVMLLVVGPTAEERFGGKRILLAIALTALVTGLVLWFFFPNSALMGASGVVFMLIVLASFAGMRTGTIPLTLILVLILYLGSEIFQAVTGTAGLAQLTHIAGGVLGMIFGFTWSRGKRGAR